MKEYAAKENYFSEEGIEESTQSLMEKLEAARNPETYRRRFHRKGRSSANANRSRGPVRTDRLSTTHLAITLAAILIGTVAGIVLSTYLM